MTSRPSPRPKPLLLDQAQLQRHPPRRHLPRHPGAHGLHGEVHKRGAAARPAEPHAGAGMELELGVY
jgi:hypothetical protein